MKRTEVVTVSAARANLSRILSDLESAGAEAEPVFIGAHRKAEGVLLSVEAFEELEALRERFERAEDMASAWGSLAAEGLQPSAQARADAKAYIEGEAEVDEIIDRTVERYRAKYGQRDRS